MVGHVGFDKVGCYANNSRNTDSNEVRIKESVHLDIDFGKDRQGIDYFDARTTMKQKSFFVW